MVDRRTENTSYELWLQQNVDICCPYAVMSPSSNFACIWPIHLILALKLPYGRVLLVWYDSIILVIQSNIKLISECYN